MIDRYHVASIEASADQVLWCCDEAPGFTANRAEDRNFVGNIVEAMLAYSENRLGEQLIQLHEVDRIICIGSDRMMAAVTQARHGILKPYLKPGASRDWLHQFTDAMHDERNLCAVYPASYRSNQW